MTPPKPGLQEFIPVALDEHLDVVCYEQCSCEQAGDCQYCKSQSVLRSLVNSPEAAHAKELEMAVSGLIVACKLKEYVDWKQAVAFGEELLTRIKAERKGCGG